jgi:glycosyltransferase involved in cell wall biosynthesis
MRKASSTIAISEHMQAICSALYLKQTEVLPLGIDANTFYSNCEHRPAIPVVVGAGTVYNAKRPEMFLALARKIKNAEFRWIGDGPSRAILSATAKNENLSNVSFPGSVGRQELARIFRQATVFALPSLSEGVPKVSQEAAACGLAQVIFGYYQSPTVVDGKNGLVVYDDDSFISAVERLVNDADLSRSMGERGALMSQLWNWDSVAPKWESAICQTIRSSLGD